jgi:hypothetical protein
MRIAREDYGVNPIIYVVLYNVSLPLFYYSLFRTLKAVAKKIKKEIMIWSAIFLFANIAPFIYVILWGKNIPWWVYGIIAILIGQGVFSLIWKIRKNKSIPEAIIPITSDV